jgi:hypothetical protein
MSSLSKLSFVCVATLLGVLALLGPAVGGPYRPGDADPLPYARQIAWDVRAFDQSPDSFTPLRRSVAGDTVTWLLTVNSAAEVDRLLYFGTQGVYTANFCDGNGVTLASVVLDPSTKDVRVNERIYYTLRLPSAEILGATRQVILKVR